uniref:SERTA domain-containing protein n=1 Tax=Chelydra serpentina TaxID=8475 RepID=A0A8C3ST65_CHESE
ALSLGWRQRRDPHPGAEKELKRKLSAREDGTSNAGAPRDAALSCLLYTTVDKFRKECVEKRPSLHRQVLICNILRRIREEMGLEKSLLPGLNPPAAVHLPPVHTQVPPASVAWEARSRFQATSQAPRGPGDTETAGFSAGNGFSPVLEALALAWDPGGRQDALADPAPAVGEVEPARLFGAGASQNHRQPDAGERRGLETMGSRRAAQELCRGSPGDAAASRSLGTALGAAWPQASAELAEPADSSFGSFEILDSGYFSDLAGDELFSAIDTLGFESLGAEAPSSRQPSQASGALAGRDWHDLDHLLEIVVGS